MTWEPTRKQLEFINSDNFEKHFESVGVADGKTEALIMLPIYRGFIKHVEFRGIILRRYYHSVQDETIPRTTLLYLPLGAIYNRDKVSWRFPSGAVVYLNYLTHIEDVNKYVSTRFHYIAFDNLKEFHREQYRRMIQLCRTLNENLPSMVRTT